MKKTLSVPEAAQELGITERALWMRIYRNVFPHRRWGRRILILRSEFEAFLNGLPGTTVEEATDRAEALGGGNDRP